MARVLATLGGCEQGQTAAVDGSPVPAQSQELVVGVGQDEFVLELTALGFLGLGAQPPIPEWGTMLNEGRPFFFVAPRLMIYPGLAISLVVMGLNLLGDGLRDVLDPALYPHLREPPPT